MPVDGGVSPAVLIVWNNVDGSVLCRPQLETHRDHL